MQSGKKRVPAQRRDGGGSRPWSRAEIRTLLALIEGGAGVSAAARGLGRRPKPAKEGWNDLRPRRAAREEEAPVKVPPELWAERERRLNAPQRTLIGACVGDPPLGYSALDRRGEPVPPRVTLPQQPPAPAALLPAGDDHDDV